MLPNNLRQGGFFTGEPDLFFQVACLGSANCTDNTVDYRRRFQISKAPGTPCFPLDPEH